MSVSGPKKGPYKADKYQSETNRGYIDAGLRAAVGLHNLAEEGLSYISGGLERLAFFSVLAYLQN